MKVLLGLVLLGMLALWASVIWYGASHLPPRVVEVEVVRTVTVEKEPNLQYRCVRAPFLAPGDWEGMLTWVKVGETAICGYNLEASGILGPNLEAWLVDGAVIQLQPLGAEPDVMCVVAEAERRKRHK